MQSTDPFKGKECRLEVNSFLGPDSYLLGEGDQGLKLTVPPEREAVAHEFAEKHGVSIVGETLRVGPKVGQ